VLIGDVRPDLLAATTGGVSVAIEIAYSSFCDLEKRQAYKSMHLPALEIDLRTFTPSAFDIAQVRRAILEDVTCKSWLWPERLGDAQVDTAEPLAVPPSTQPRRFLPEEIVTVSGRWVSVKTLPSGDIAIKAVRYDPEVVSVVRAVARAHHGRYREAHHNWVIPRFRANAARAQLRTIAATMQH